MLAGALIIPTLLFNSQRKLKYYIDKNGLINDPAYEKKVSTVWTTEEMELFKIKFVQYPKKFSIIASFLKNKSVHDCVQFYYLSKKRVNYKHLVGKFPDATVIDNARFKLIVLFYVIFCIYSLKNYSLKNTEYLFH